MKLPILLIPLVVSMLDCPWMTEAFMAVPHFNGESSSSSSSPPHLFSDPQCDEHACASSRRKFLLTSSSVAALVVGQAQPALAGIDVSGLPVDGSGVRGNPSIASQLKSYDGSGSAQVNEIKSAASVASGTSTQQQSTSSSSSSSTQQENPKVATWAYRANPGFGASLTPAGPLRTLYRYNDQVVAPKGSKLRSIPIQFEFPSDWLQLDRAIGGIQYVDQRNGDKLYVLRATLPAESSDLATLPKSTLGELVFSPEGSIAKSGNTIQDYKVASAQVLNECPNNMCATRRRFKIKYSTVTGNGLEVERRALVDAYQVEGDIYMLVTSSNAVKFEKKDSIERETVENIVNSFRLDA